MQYLNQAIDILLESISTYRAEAILVLLCFNIILMIWLIINSFKIRRINKSTRAVSDILKYSDGQSMEESVVKVLRFIDEAKEDQRKMDSKIAYIEDMGKKSIQNVGFIRYNAFGDMGSDLSFSLALLDKSLDGVIISNIYGRDESNVYAKPVKQGKSEYKLSVEEMQSLDRAKSRPM